MNKNKNNSKNNHNISRRTGLKKIKESVREKVSHYEETRMGQKISKAGLIRVAIVCVLIILVIVAAVTVVQRKKYTEYAVNEDSITPKTDNVSNYEAVENYILRYSSDGASLLNKNLKSRWNVTYDMDNPSADICEDTFVIYDHNGTNLQIFDQDGPIGSFKTSSPIVKARVSKNGNVAALVSENDAAVIHYYTSEGTEIAAISSTLKTNGYPLDFDLSPNGLYMTIAFAKIESSGIGTLLNFYDFSSSGSSYEENMASSDTYDSVVIPQVYYTDDTTIAAISEDGFAIYKGKKPALKKRVTFDEEIISFFHDDEKLGFVFQDENSDSPYIMKIYGIGGNLKSSKTIGVDFEKAQVSSGQLILTGSSQLGIYDMSGNCKFEGTLNEGDIASCLRIGDKQYLLVTNSKTETIYLK